MLTTPEVLAAYEADRPAIAMAGSGFAELDGLTGGMIPGRVWILVGTPGQGRSTLVTQWAAAIAEGGEPAVHLVTPRDGPSAVATRLLSQIGRVPLPHLTSHSVNPTDEGRLGLVGDRVAALNLCVFAKGDAAYIPEVDSLRPQEASAVFVDDADRVSGLTPQAVAKRAAAGLFVLIALPRHHVLVAPHHEADLEPVWGGIADVVVEVRHRGLTDGDLRPGEAELQLHYNRWGYVRTIAAQHQAHYSRFLECPTTSSR